MSQQAVAVADIGAQPSVLVEAGRLTIGVVHNGFRHCDFTLRLATVEDNFYALEQVGLDTDEAAQELTTAVSRSMRVNLAMFSQQLLTLGGIPQDQISYAMLRQNLAPADYDVLWDKNEALKKKRTELPEFGAISGPSPLSSGSVPALPSDN